MGLTQITTGGVDDNINIDSNTLKVDGTNNLVGIGTAAPANKLHVSDTSGSAQIRITGSSGSSNIYADSNIYFQPNGSTKVTFLSNGRVGIGESSPAANLEITPGTGAGTLLLNHASGSMTDGALNIEVNSGGAFYETRKTGGLGHIWYAAGVERMRIDSSGRLLLGTTTEGVSGGDQFTISATGHSGMTIRSGTSNRGAIYFSDGTSGNAEYRGYIEYDQTDDYMRFGTGGAQRVRIDSSGNVGINNSSPGSYNSDGRNLVVGSGSGGQGLSIASGTSNYGTIYFADGTSGDALYRGAVLYNHGSDFMRLDTAAGERMRIDSSGNVGIGNSDPGTMLHVSDSNDDGTFRVGGNNAGNTGFNVLYENGGNTYTILKQNYATTNASAYTSIHTGYFTVNTGTSLNERMRIDSSGRLLAGLTSSSKNARIVAEGNSDNAASSAEVYLQRGTATPSDGHDLASIHFADNTGTTGAVIRGRRDGGSWSGSSKPSSLLFSTCANGASSPTERMRIRSDGRMLVPGVYAETTGGAENVNVQSDGLMQRSVSSIKYKKDVETLEDSYADALLDLRPVWYKSKCASDNPDWGYWGFIAEELAQIDPRLVIWKTEEVTADEDGNQVKTACDPEPEGVQYSRFVPHLLNLIKRQQTAIETLETKVAALEAG